MVIVFRFYSLLTILLSFLTSACVGPTTPFGSIDSIEEAIYNSSYEPINIPLRHADDIKIPTISFSPSRQVLHNRSELVVEITDLGFIPKDYKIHIIHNKRDVTKQFLANSTKHITNDRKKLIYKYKNLRLKDRTDNDIEITYVRPNGIVARKSFLPPVCSLFAYRTVASLENFNSPSTYLDLIHSVADEARLNPSFIAGIVAQESGFNPFAVSWAKAMGLTQITPLAEKEIIGNFKHWPRYPGINKMHYLSVKSKILMGEINGEKEWRLNPEKNLRGGVAYIQYLKKYWQKPTNRNIVKALAGNFEVNLSQIIMASYNSGAARVKRAISDKADNWKKHPKLHEAYNYLNKVSSYCHHFPGRSTLL